MAAIRTGRNRDAGALVGEHRRDPLSRRSFSPHVSVEHAGRDSHASRSRCGFSRIRAANDAGERLCSLRQRPRHLGLAACQLLSGLSDRAAQNGLPAGMRGLAPFHQAVRTSLYHELAAILGAVVVFALTLGQPNQIGVMDLRHPMVDASERQVQCLFRRAQSRRGDAARSFAFSRRVSCGVGR